MLNDKNDRVIILFQNRFSSLTVESKMYLKKKNQSYNDEMIKTTTLTVF